MSQTRSTVTVTLARPLQQGDKSVSSITLSEPNVGHLRGLKLSDVLQMDMNAHVTLWSRINAEGLSASELSDLSMSDVTALASKTMLFFVSPQQAALIEEGLDAGGINKEPSLN